MSNWARRLMKLGCDQYSLERLSYLHGHRTCGPEEANRCVARVIKQCSNSRILNVSAYLNTTIDSSITFIEKMPTLRQHALKDHPTYPRSLTGQNQMKWSHLAAEPSLEAIMPLEEDTKGKGKNASWEKGWASTKWQGNMGTKASWPEDLQLGKNYR